MRRKGCESVADYVEQLGMAKTFAVIKTGGKQYRVSPGQKVKVEKLPDEEGGKVTFDEVLLLNKDGKVSVGKPTVDGAKVEGKVLEQGKHKKQIVYKMQPKKRTRKKTGHRQPYTEVEITKIA